MLCLTKLIYYYLIFSQYTRTAGVRKNMFSLNTNVSPNLCITTELLNIFNPVAYLYQKSKHRQSGIK